MLIQGRVHKATCAAKASTQAVSAAVFASAGQPYNRDACAIRCADGMYPTKDLASAAASNLEASVCQPCNNTKPPNAIYSGPSHLVGVPFCPWACDEGVCSCFMSQIPEEVVEAQRQSNKTKNKSVK